MKEFVYSKLVYGDRERKGKKRKQESEAQERREGMDKGVIQ